MKRTKKNLIASPFTVKAAPSDDSSINPVWRDSLPKWFPSDIPAVDGAWILFCTDPCGATAIEAVWFIAKTGFPIPERLLPWLNEACEAWTKADGNKRPIRKRKTANKWRTALHQVWMEYMAGNKQEVAIMVVAERLSIPKSTLGKEYRSKKFTKQRDAKEASLKRQYEQSLEEENTSDIQALETFFPRLFKQ